MSVDRDKIVRHILECNMCLEKYDDNARQPRILPCQHSFCLSCLKATLVNKTIVCGQCRAENEVTDIDLLPKDNTRRDLMDILEGGGARTCTMCDEGHVAVSFCPECDDYMCEACRAAHGRLMKKKAGHNVVNLDTNGGHAIEGTSGNTRTVLGGNAIEGTSGNTRMVLGGNDKKATKTQMFCLNCDKVVETCTECHKLVSLDEGCIIRQKDMRALIDKLKAKIAKNGLSQAKGASVQENQSFTFLKERLQDQFKAYNDILKNRLEELLSQLTERHKQNETVLQHNVKDISNYETEATNALTLAESLIADASKADFLAMFISSKTELNRLCGIDIMLAHAKTLVFTEACTSDDFKRIIEAIGCFRDRPEIPDNYVTRAELSSSINEPTNTANSLENLMLSLESHQSEQLMGALKSLTLSGHPYAVSTILPSEGCELPLHSFTSLVSNERGVTPASDKKLKLRPFLSRQPMESSDSSDVKAVYDQYKAKLPAETLPNGKADLLKLELTNALIQARFQTHRLDGDWALEENKLTVYANSVEQAEYCRQIMEDSVFGRGIAVRPESKILVHSDKWLDVTRLQHKKYSNQITIDVDHAQNAVTVYSSSPVILRDVHDAIAIFFRDNELKTIHLKLNENVLTLLLKQTKCIKRLLASWSHFCVDVTKHDDVTIRVKGIGIGLAHVTRGVHELAGKCVSALASGKEDDGDDDDDDDRSDDDDDDDEPRFDVDHLPTGRADVQLNLHGVDADLRSLSLIGDDRVVYVIHGDVTALPVEVIVNPANKTLKHNGGLAKVLVKKGGRIIQDECRDYLDQHGELQVGQVMCSGAGVLRSRLIVHTVGPKWTNGRHEEESQLERAVYNSLLEANKRMMVSMAIPAIGAGAFGFPTDTAVKCITRAVKNFFLSKPASCIREVYLVDISPDTVRGFTEALQELFPDGDHVVSSLQEHVQEQLPHRPLVLV